MGLNSGKETQNLIRGTILIIFVKTFIVTVKVVSFTDFFFNRATNVTKKEGILVV